MKGDLTAVRIDKSTGAFETMGIGGAAGRARLGVLHHAATTSAKDADEIPGAARAEDDVAVGRARAATTW